jgi:hypothetical protein
MLRSLVMIEKKMPTRDKPKHRLLLKVAAAALAII